MAVCPNKSHPDYKALVTKYGEDGALRRYIKNNYKIPTVNGVDKSNRRKTIIEKVFGPLGQLYKSKSTLDSMEKHPEVAIDIINELNTKMPWVRVFKDRIIDENGNYLEIPSDKQGRHYRSAFMSAVAWSNDSAMETPPHEYAHEYIDMYRNTPLVIAGIEKYGEERLVTLIARKYTGQKMSSSFEQWLSKFWDMVRNTFGSPSIVDILTDSFAKNERLGSPLVRANEVHNFQEANGPMLDNNDIFNYTDEIKNNVKDNTTLTTDEALKAIRKEFVDKKVVGGEEVSKNITLEKTRPTSAYIKIRDAFKSMNGFRTLIQLKDSKNLKNILNRIVPFAKPELNSLTQAEALRKIWDIQKQGKGLILSDDKQYYVNKVTGQRYERQSNFIQRLLGKDPPTGDDLKRGAAVGNLIDLIGRGVFDEDVKTLKEYIILANNANEENGYRVDMSEEQFQSLKDSFNLLKSEMEGKGMKVVANDVLVFREFTEEEKNDPMIATEKLTGVAGTLDLVAVDKQGNTHIVDFKNIRLTETNKVNLEKSIYDGGVFYGKPESAKIDTWSNQQSTYQALMEANGLPVASTNILPISTVYQSETDEDSIDQQRFNNWWKNIKKFARETHKSDSDKKELNYAGVDLSIFDLIDNVVFSTKKDDVMRLIMKLRGDDVNLTEAQEAAYNGILQIMIATAHKNALRTKFVSLDGKKRVEKSHIVPVVESEIGGQEKVRANNLASKNKFTRWVAERLNGLMTHVTNNGLWAKYLSGGEFTATSKVLNTDLLKGRKPYQEYTQKFWELLGNASKGFQNSSTYYNEKVNIENLQTETFKLEPSINEGVAVSEIQLTKAEMLMVYLMHRQDKGDLNLDLGIYLDPIPGRELNSDEVYKLTREQIAKINIGVEANPDAMAAIKNIDATMKYSRSKLNPVFHALEGYDIENIPNYFPIFHSKKHYGVPKSKNVIDDYRGFRRRFGAGPVRLVDPFKVLDGMQLANAAYVGYAIPIHNAQMLMNDIRGKFDAVDSREKGGAGFLSEIQGTIDMIQDGSLLFTTQGQQGWARTYNKLLGNFAVSHLAKNVGVVFKQQISLETAKNVIDGQFIRKSGFSMLGLPIITPWQLIKQLKWTGFKGGETWMPIEWQPITNDADYLELMEDALYQARFEGMVSRESGEVVMGKRTQDDIIEIPFTKRLTKDGKNIQITKSRAMLGVTTMDTLTILRLYKSVKLETQSRMGEAQFAKMTEAQLKEHNFNRLQEIVDKTQPTFDIINRTGFARNPHPVARALTMFSSATQKMYGRTIDAFIEANMNPTPENKKKLYWQLVSTMVTTSAMLATIDAIWYGIGHGWDDDDWDTLPARYGWQTLRTATGVPIVGQAMGTAISLLDDAPWQQTIQDPLSKVVQNSGEGLASIVKGDLFQATKKLTDVYFSSKGLPLVPVNKTMTWAKNLTED